MAGLNFGVGGRLGLGSTMASPAATPAVAASSVAPSAAAFGVGATYPTSKPSALSTSPGHLAIYAGFAALGFVGLTWWSLPKGERNSYGRDIFTIAMVIVMMRGVSLWGKAHVAEGDTQGAMGEIYKTAVLL